jgi:hypothetical protein
MLVACIIAWGLFLFSRESVDGMMAKIPLEQLALSADLIFVGRVKTVKGYEKKIVPTPQQKKEFEYIIWSVAEVVAEVVVKGHVESQPILIEFPGGHVGEKRFWVEDSPDYKVGEEIVVFLKRIEDRFYYTTIGMFQGKYIIRDGTVEREGVPFDKFIERIRCILSHDEE